MIKTIIFLLIFIIKFILFNNIVFINTIIMITCTFFAYHLNKKHFIKKNIYFSNKIYSVYKMLDFYFIRDIKHEILKLFLLFSCTIGLLFLFCFKALNTNYDIWLLFFSTHKNISYILLINVLLMVISFSLYLRYMITILKDIYYKHHVYLLQYKFYYNLMDDLFFRYNHSIANEITLLIRVYCSEFLDPDPDYDSYYIRIYSNKPNKIKLFLFLRRLTQTNKHVKNLIIKINAIAIFFQDLETMILHYWPLLLVFVIFCIDLKNNEIKYIYYGLFLYTIIILYRKFRLFIGQTDYREIDDRLRYYFYSYNAHISFVEHEHLLKTQNDFFEIYNLIKNRGIVYEIYDMLFAKKIENYFERNFIVDYIDLDRKKKSYEPYSIRVLLFCIFVLYYLFCYNLSIINCFFITIPLISAFVIYEYTFANHKKLNYIWLYKIIYLLLIFISCTIFIYIFLMRHTFYFIDEYLWKWGFEIIQNFSMEEKIAFMKAYLEYKSKYLSKDVKNELLYIFSNIPFKDIIQDIPINSLKTYIENLIKMHAKLTHIYFILEKRYYYKSIAEQIKNNQSLFNRHFSRFFKRRR